MDKIRNQNNMVLSEKVEPAQDTYTSKNDIYIFYKNGKKFFYKKCFISEIIRELLADELANDYGINHVHYYVGRYTNEWGVYSEDFIKDNTYISIGDLIKELYGEKKIYDHNNLTDIWDALDYKFKNSELVAKLMDQIIDIFIFDVLLANADRNYDNFGILISKTDVNISPIFDNEMIFPDKTYYLDQLKLKVYDEDDNRLKTVLSKFINESSKEYLERLKEKLWIISEENIDKAIKHLEENVDLVKYDNSIFTKDIKDRAQKNHDKIDLIIKEIENKKTI